MKIPTTLFATAVLSLATHWVWAQGMGMGAANFSVIDMDSSGDLTAAEIAALPFIQSDDQALEILTSWDTDDSGTVSEVEFNNRPAMGMRGMGGMGGMI
ncbi:MAG: hypothetical protein ACI88G_002161 [Woeseiaceae bacterium]|jgi:hypothetical protein